MHYKARIDKRVQQVKMPENLAIGMMVREQRKKCLDLQCPFDIYAFAFENRPFRCLKA